MKYDVLVYGKCNIRNIVQYNRGEKLFGAFGMMMMREFFIKICCEGVGCAGKLFNIHMQSSRNNCKALQPNKTTTKSKYKIEIYVDATQY